ncbi:MAG: ABC transporter ATP-binding protein [Saccharofermentanales bacterium]|jgi:ABC-2 type transport system ATP-binding protein
MNKLNSSIEIKGLKKRLGNFVLGPLDLDIPQGSMVGYIGENGAGKSTTIKLILDIMRPDSGEIKIFGKKSSQLSTQEREKIGVVLDDIHLPGELNLKQIAKFCEKLFHTWQVDTFNNLLEKFKLNENKQIKEFSRGMRMKLSIAIALSHGAKLLLLDEATSGLDPIVRDDILDILADFMQDEQCSILISSHILSDLEKNADYIAFLHEGKIHFMEGKDELKEKYALCQTDKDTVQNIDPAAIVGRREHNFGVELLVEREHIPLELDLTIERPSIEDIMLFMTKSNLSDQRSFR